MQETLNLGCADRVPTYRDDDGALDPLNSRIQSGIAPDKSGSPPHCKLFKTFPNSNRRRMIRPMIINSLLKLTRLPIAIPAALVVLLLTVPAGAQSPTNPSMTSS